MAYESGKATVRGPTAVAAANLRMYLLEYLGARFIATEWRRVRGCWTGASRWGASTRTPTSSASWTRGAGARR